MTQYHLLSDEELIKTIRSQDNSGEEAVNELFSRYKEEVKRASRAYFLIGSDQQDLLQEGMIGLYKAVRGYDEKAGAFANYAHVCISRQLISAVRSSQREKNLPLNEAMSLDQTVRDEEGEETSVSEMMPDLNEKSPEDHMLEQYGEQELLNRIKGFLSSLENKVLDLYLSGYSCREIADKMNISEKSADNAIQRIRRKTKTHLAYQL